MNLKKKEEHSHHKRKIGAFWGKVVKILTVKFIAFLVLILFLMLFGVSYAQAPIKALVAQLTKPKPIIQSSTAISANVQSAIQNLATQEIKQEQANANLAVTLPDANSSTTSIFQPLIDTVQEMLTSDPSDKAKIKLKIIDREIAELQNLLEKDKSDKAASQAVKIIADIGKNSGGVVTDPKVQRDREILKLQIEQYNRLQLILQKLEDNLPIESYFKVEDARVKYLVSGAQASLNAAPNLDAVHNIAIKEVGRLVGNDFAEIKAIEILSDIESGLNPDTKVKLANLEKELAVQFEKKMLKLPRDVRERKLQNYINYSYGNPLRQIQSYDRMKDFMSDREIILGLDSVKEITFKKLENRIFELDTQEKLNQFLEKVLTNLSDLKVLTQMKLDIDSGKDKTRKQKLAQMQTSVERRISQFFGKNLPQVSKNADLLDIALISNLNDIISKSSDLPEESKQAFKNIKTQTLSSFVKNLSLKGFTTRSSIAYDPVSPNADVRILLSSPQAIQILQAVKQELPEDDKSKIDIALRAQASILQEHILLQVNDPEVFKQYQQFITDNPQVKQTIQNYVGQNFFANLAQKKKLINKQSKEDEQKLFEKMQQIVQQIFIAPDGKFSDEEKQLPTEVQGEINKLKQELPDNNVPKLTTPEGVTLPEVAKLPDKIEQAIIQAAKDQIKDQQKSEEIKLDLTVQAKDLGVGDPIILPDSPLYKVVEFVRDIELIAALDPIQRAEELIKQDNEKTLEAAKLVEESQSQKTIELALETLSSVSEDFNKLKEHADDLKKLEQTQPEKVDQLVDQIIDNGLARQTVFSAIEDKVYGDQYVEVEKVRSDILADGVETLLNLTDNNVSALTDKLEKAVEENQGSEFKEIKASELLTEIARTQGEVVDKILDQSQEQLAQKLEEKLLAMPTDVRTQKLEDYVDSSSGNPVRQFEAYDHLEDHFNNPEIKLLAEGLKDKAVENLTERISEITDGASQQQFAEEVVGERPEDLKIITEIEIRVEQPPKEDTPQTLTTIEQKIEDIKGVVEENIIDEYKDKPEELAKAQISEVVDVVDAKVVADLTDTLSRSPEVEPAVVAAAKDLEEKTVDQLVKNLSQIEVSGQINSQVQVLEPIPEVIAILAELKDQSPPSVDAKIDLAINAQVDLMQEHLTTQVNDPQTFETYVAQIEGDPNVLEVIKEVGGSDFTNALEEKGVQLATVAQTEHSTLEQTVTQITHEIFSTTQESKIEQTLPQNVQKAIEEIKHEVPVEQIPAVEVQAAVTVETTPLSTPQPSSAPAESAPATPDVAPAPALPEVKPPETQSAPAVEQPQAPAVPGL